MSFSNLSKNEHQQQWTLALETARVSRFINSNKNITIMGEVI